VIDSTQIEIILEDQAVTGDIVQDSLQ